MKRDFCAETEILKTVALNLVHLSYKIWREKQIVAELLLITVEHCSQP